MMNTSRKNETTGEHNRIVERTTVQGHINSLGDIRVDGQVKGNLTVGGKLVVGPTGTIDGQVKATEAAISGRVIGKLEIKGLTTLSQSANVEAEIMTGKLAVETGAQFSGTCTMNNGKTATASPLSKTEQQTKITAA
jgi:cytoskeletal protein CcmA (bactofilin family)